MRDPIRFDTSNPPGNERKRVSCIQRLLESSGFDTLVVWRSRDRPHLITRIKGLGQAPSVLLHGHVDVVPAREQQWQQPPFDANLAEGYIWGQRALDMKGYIAMMLVSLLRAKSEGVALPGDGVLALVSDEEAGGEFGANAWCGTTRTCFGNPLCNRGIWRLQLPHNKTGVLPHHGCRKALCVMRATIWGSGGHWSLRTRSSATGRLAQALCRLDCCQLPIHLTTVTV